MKAAALLLLLLQVKPLAAAAVCLETVSASTECEMPAEDSKSVPGQMPSSHDQDPVPTPPLGCTDVAICGAVAPAVEAGPAELQIISWISGSQAWFVPEGHSADPTAPPAPPPNP